MKISVNVLFINVKPYEEIMGWKGLWCEVLKGNTFKCIKNLNKCVRDVSNFWLKCFKNLNKAVRNVSSFLVWFGFIKAFNWINKWSFLESGKWF